MPLRTVPPRKRKAQSAQVGKGAERLQRRPPIPLGSKQVFFHLRRPVRDKVKANSAGADEGQVQFNYVLHCRREDRQRCTLKCDI